MWFTSATNCILGSVPEKSRAVRPTPVLEIGQMDTVVDYFYEVAHARAAALAVGH